jgi:MscS family membrane protein
MMAPIRHLHGIAAAPARGPLLALLLGLLALLGAVPTAAQVPGLPEAEATAEVAAPDPLGRDTPRGAVSGLLLAIANGDAARAARYLEAPPGIRLDDRTVMRVEAALNAAGRFRSPGDLSLAEAGDLDDGLEPDEERVGVVVTEEGEAPLLARRGASDQPAPEGAEPARIWRLSDDAVRLLLTLDGSALDRGVMGDLRAALAALPAGPTVVGVPLRDWAVLLAIAALAYLAAWAVTGLLRAWGRRMVERRMDGRFSRLVVAVEPPLRVLLAAILFTSVAQGLSVSVVARYQLGWIVELASWFSALWILWRVTDAIAAQSLEQMSRRGAVTAYSVATFANRLVKALIVVIFVGVALRSFGVDITAGLAALGVGGLALALGAQTLVANLLGSVTLIADRPVRVGDFCAFGTTLGTVEEIGIRSTRIRTLARTVVTVPNGEFSNLHIENFTLRDRFLFNPAIGLRYETTPAQLRSILADLDGLLRDTPEVVQDGARVRFVRFAAYSLDLEFFAYVLATDIADFLEKQEALMLEIMTVVERNGSSFAFPSQTLYLGRDEMTAAGAAPSAPAPGPRASAG